jgi:tetratricopeptide (TPR) repeat protein
MRRMFTGMPRRPGARARAGFAVLAMVLSVLAGCATRGKVEVPAARIEAPVAKVEAPAPKLEAPVAQEPSPVIGPSVAGLPDGREGFVITEVSTMDEESRRDFDRAVAMLKGQDYGRAIDLLGKVIERSPGVTAPYIDIAIAYQRIGKPERAEEHLRTALTLFPGHPVACNEYGLLHRKNGRFAEARAIYEKAIEGFPAYYPAHRNLGILCDLYLDDTACALRHYEIYEEARPEDQQVKLWIVNVRARLGRN